MSKKLLLEVGACPRCGDNHKKLVFFELDRFIVEEGGAKLTHFASCPKNKQPILHGFRPRSI